MLINDDLVSGSGLAICPVNEFEMFAINRFVKSILYKSSITIIMMITIIIIMLIAVNLHIMETNSQSTASKLDECRRPSYNSHMHE